MTYTSESAQARDCAKVSLPLFQQPFKISWLVIRQHLILPFPVMREAGVQAVTAVRAVS
jgi:hypothetical protein